MTSDLARTYSELRKTVLIPICERLQQLLLDYMEDESRVDRVTTRAKTVDSFMKKAVKVENEDAVYSDPLHQIQDQIGARIITFYISDVDRLAEVVDRYFRPIEDRFIVPDKDSEFGYFGRHFVLFLPRDVIPENLDDFAEPKFFELQVKTLYQHAWSEANHNLGYKELAPLTSGERRKIAFTAAQSWGADTIFEELFQKKSSKRTEPDA